MENNLKVDVRKRGDIKSNTLMKEEVLALINKTTYGPLVYQTQTKPKEYWPISPFFTLQSEQR